MTFESQTDLLTTHRSELVKVFIDYDGFNRMEKVYTAAAEALNGAPCLLTEYAYDGASVRIIKRKESKSTWNSAWDL